jgi:hypothetical protein
MPAVNVIKQKEYFADQLHVAVLDTIVDHLDVVTCAFLADPVTTWLAICLGCDRLEDFLDMGPCIWMTTRHQRRAVTSAFLTTRHTCSNEEITISDRYQRSLPLISEVFASTVRVGEMRVSSIDNDVPWD